MKKISRYLKLYMRITSQYIKARMEYKVDFCISFIGMIFFNISGFLFLWVLFQSVPSLEGWEYNKLIFMYGFLLLALCPYQIFFENMHNLRLHIIQGSFFKYYLRPMNMMFYYFSEVLDLKGLGQLVLGLGVIIYATTLAAVRWTFLKVLLFLFLLFSSSLVMVSLMLIAAFSSFWILNSFALMDFIYKLKEFARFPITIFNNFFRFLFTCIIPIGFISYYPVKFILNGTAVPFFLFLTPLLAGTVLFAVACIMWKIGVSGYSGTGT